MPQYRKDGQIISIPVIYLFRHTGHLLCKEISHLWCLLCCKIYFTRFTHESSKSLAWPTIAALHEFREVRTGFVPSSGTSTHHKVKEFRFLSYESLLRVILATVREIKTGGGVWKWSKTKQLRTIKRLESNCPVHIWLSHQCCELNVLALQLETPLLRY